MICGCWLFLALSISVVGVRVILDVDAFLLQQTTTSINKNSIYTNPGLWNIHNAKSTSKRFVPLQNLDAAYLNGFHDEGTSVSKKWAANRSPLFRMHQSEGTLVGSQWKKPFSWCLLPLNLVKKQWLHWKPIVSVKQLRRWLYRSLAAVALFCMIHCTVIAPSPAWAAGSSGRMGGSFGSSGRSGGSYNRIHSSPSRTSSYSSSPRSTYSRPIRILPLYHHHHHHHHHRHIRDNAQTTTAVVNADGTTTIVRRESRQQPGIPPELFVIAAAAAFVSVGVIIHKQEMDKETGPDSPLGPGFTVLSFTACLNVPDRNDPNSILARIRHLAQTSDTGTRKGLQKLMAETSLELARQEKAIVAVESHYDHIKHDTEAERRYNRLSAKLRSKFEREDYSNYGGEQRRLPSPTTTISSSSLITNLGPTATMALINIHLAIEGNSLRAFDNIKTRKDLIDVLAQITSDVQVEDCLLSGEVIWCPEDPTEQVYMADVYADFPTLYTLMD